MTAAPPAMLNVNDRYRSLVEDLRLIVWEFDPSTKRFVYVSPQAQTILGYSLEAWQQPAFWFEHLHPDDRAEASRFSQEHVRRGEDHEFEYRMIKADGGVAWLRDLTSVIKRDGAVVALHGVMIDVSERQRTEEALRQSERRFRSLAENSVVGIWQITPAGHTLYINPAMCRILGVEGPAALSGVTFHEFFTPESLKLIDQQLRRRMAGESSSYEAELKSRDGRLARVIIAGSPVFGPGGRTESIIGTIIDITERDRAEHALRESEARLRAVIDNAPSVAIQGYDVHGRVLFWNRAAETMFGWTEAEALGKTLDHLMLDAAGNDVFLATLREIQHTAQPASISDTEFTRRDGTRGWCYSTVFQVPGEAAPAFICMDVDVTERKHAEQALAKSNELQRLLLSELDHRVRNNLASLTALIDISSRDSRSVPDFAASIRSRVQAISVVHALLSREHWRSVDLRQLILTLAPVGAQQALDMRGPTVSVVPRQATALGMVLQELLANCQKYGSLAKPGGTVGVTWTLDPVNPRSGERRLRLQWCERGGEPIVTPIQEGVGTGLILGLVRTELRGEATLGFPRDGAAHDFVLLMDDAGASAETSVGAVVAKV